MAIFNLNVLQYSCLESMLKARRDLSGKKYLNEVYVELAKYITASDGSKLAGVGGSIWHFVNAAASINKDGNDMATVTREYSAFQSAVRKGVPFDEIPNIGKYR